MVWSLVLTFQHSIFCLSLHSSFFSVPSHSLHLPVLDLSLFHIYQSSSVYLSCALWCISCHSHTSFCCFLFFPPSLSASVNICLLWERLCVSVNNMWLELWHSSEYMCFRFTDLWCLSGRHRFESWLHHVSIPFPPNISCLLCTLFDNKR